MNKHLWTFNEPGKITTETDANDYYYEWTEIEAGDKTLKDLLAEFIGDAHWRTVAIRVKARDGAIFIVREGDKDDTPNPETVTNEA